MKNVTTRQYKKGTILRLNVCTEFVNKYNKNNHF